MAQVIGWAVLTAVLDLAFRLQVTSYGKRPRVGFDFGIYWKAGSLLVQGHDPYQSIRGRLGFVYPPGALLPFEALSHLGQVAAFEVWLAVQAGLLALLLVLAVRRGMKPWLVIPASIAIVLDGYVSRCTALGQVGIMLLGLVAVDFLVPRGRHGRGLLTGIAIGIKFTPGIFLVHWLVRRDWRAAATSLIGFLSTIVAGFIWAPSASRHYWSELFHQHQLGTGVPSQYGNANNQSITNAVQMLLGPSPMHANLGSLLGLIFAVAGLTGGILADRSGRPWLTVALLGTASCLATGSTWDHHYVWSVAAIISLCAGELAGLWSTIAVVVLWTLWSFTNRWHHLAYLPRAAFGAGDYVASVATPVFAVLFVVATTITLFTASHRHRAGRVVTDPSTPIDRFTIPDAGVH